ncbi:MAG: hypothetical protein FWD61_19540 [Phycisphaerales bacterium]|nr:hypothetical protein [Phycisphaerales bacterium]
MVWGIDIKKQSSGEVVAHWDADLGGIDWLEKLVEEKRAVCQQEGFYPSIYTAQAKDILPILQDMPPFVKEGRRWKEDGKNGWVDCGKMYYFNVSKDEVATCVPDELLCITVWDSS